MVVAAAVVVEVVVAVVLVLAVVVAEVVEVVVAVVVVVAVAVVVEWGYGEGDIVSRASELNNYDNLPKSDSIDRALSLDILEREFDTFLFPIKQKKSRFAKC